MNNRRASLFLVVLPLLITEVSWAQATKFSDEFNAHHKAYYVLAEDLATMVKADPNSLDGTIASGLLQTTLMASAGCGTGAEIFLMRELVRGPADQKVLDQYLRTSLASHAQMFDRFVESTNRNLMQTRSAGLASTANRLKDQLRATKALFERARPSE